MMPHWAIIKNFKLTKKLYTCLVSHLQMAHPKPWSNLTEQQLFTEMKQLDRKILSLEKEINDANKQWFMHQRGLGGHLCSPLLVPFPKSKTEWARKMKTESVKVSKLRQVYYSVSDAWWERALN